MFKCEYCYEISSRRQDTEQALKWSMSGYNGEKWKKDSKQCKSTLYVADYDSCKYQDYFMLIEFINFLKYENIIYVSLILICGYKLIAQVFYILELLSWL